ILCIPGNAKNWQRPLRKNMRCWKRRTQEARTILESVGARHLRPVTPNYFFASPAGCALSSADLIFELPARGPPKNFVPFGEMIVVAAIRLDDVVALWDEARAFKEAAAPFFSGPRII